MAAFACIGLHPLQKRAAKFHNIQQKELNKRRLNG